MINNTVVNNSNNWNDLPSDFYWIKAGDNRHQYIRHQLIDEVFPVLSSSDKELLLDSVVKIINLICLKFSFRNNRSKNENLLWEQLTQNKLLDLRAILLLSLPYIDDNETDDNKRSLRRLRDLYLELNPRGNYKYTNSQYNRCVRHHIRGKTSVLDRPFLKEYFLDHLEMILMSIETSANKLYVNWVDVLPVTMNSYTETQLYADTVSKILATHTTESRVRLIHNYIDPNPGISYQDMYNVISNHLYHQIKNYRWLIYDIVIDQVPVSYITYLESKFDFGDIWDDLTWSQISPNSANKFIYEWRKFLDSAQTSIIDGSILFNFHYYFSKYYRKATELVSEKKLIPHSNIELEEEDEDTVRITMEAIRISIQGISDVPTEDIYAFFYSQLSAFKTSWYYYLTRIKREPYLDKQSHKIASGSEIDIYTTPKNIYNYCKSMVSYMDDKFVQKFVQIPHHWVSLKPNLIEMILIRLLDIPTGYTDFRKNNWNGFNWFSIGNYIKKIYPNVIEKIDFIKINHLLHLSIRTKLVDAVFESLIYHGLLSDFRPNKSITDENTNTAGFSEQYQLDQILKQYFTGAVKTNFETNAYYYITGKPYKQLGNYFKDIISLGLNWPFIYAMNWASQLNFYHHYANLRVMYITGGTGVGKSTQVPKLLLYGQKMIDYNSNGKIICTQPRVAPTVGNAERISVEMGVPIKKFNSRYDEKIATSNYYVQYKHQKGSHIDRHINSFLRIVTDGTLWEEIKKSPFMTRSKQDPYAIDIDGNAIDWVQTYLASNIYDIIIVDEAHEHNHNMDLILTLARDACYVNNSLKLVIVSATMEDDEPIYRRYYRTINDNRAYPLSAFIENQPHDRANMDRRIHISPPGKTTPFKVTPHYLPQYESDAINENNFVQAGIDKTIQVINATTKGDILLFMSGQADIHEAVKQINSKTGPDIIALGFYSEMTEADKEFVGHIDDNLPLYTRYKDDVLLEEKNVFRRVPKGTYTRAVIIATNVAEASITIRSLRYIVDTGYAKVAIFDPLEGVGKTLTLPISKSSSTQRMGRIGRRAPGDFYPLYSAEKIINNKTAYKITDINIRDIMVSLLKSDSRDSFIITPDNDINAILNLRRMEGSRAGSNLIYDFLKNPRPYLDIIKKQYLYMPDISDPKQYYIFYGITNKETYPTLQSIMDNFDKYLLNNHDDYDYQLNTEIFRSRGYTGYNVDILADTKLTFYIIHPEENIIHRNLYTGEMVGLKNNPSVTASYYYYVLEANDIDVDSIDRVDASTNSNSNSNINSNNLILSSVDLSKINYENFQFIKFGLALDDARSQLLIMQIPVKKSDIIISYTNTNANEYARSAIRSYYTGKAADYTLNNDIIRSNILINLNDIKSLASLDILNNTNNTLWYAYSIVYELETDVLALMIMIDTEPDISLWIDDTKSKKSDVLKYVNLHLNKQGDIYFFWELWNTVKEMLISRKIFALTEINISMESDFLKYKKMYQDHLKMPLDKFKIFENMYKSEKLNTVDEFLSYLDLLTMDFKDILSQKNIISDTKIIASNHKLNPTLLLEFITEYLNMLFSLNKKIWIYEKSTRRADFLAENLNANLLHWAKTKLALPGINYDPNYVQTKWDRVLETYLRAHSINLIKNEGYYYLRISKGVRLDPDYWSKKN